MQALFRMMSGALLPAAATIRGSKPLTVAIRENGLLSVRIAASARRNLSSARQLKDGVQDDERKHTERDNAEARVGGK